MKPSERRALEAEKRAQKLAEMRERELAKEAKNAEKQRENKSNDFAEPARESKNGRIAPEATYKNLPEEEIKVTGDGYHRESFFSNYARLIAFIITTAVVLFVVGPLGYDIYLNIKDARDQATQVEGKAMTIEDLNYIIDHADEIGWSNLTKFTHSDYGDEREFAIDGTAITLRVGKSKTSDYPEYMRLIHYGSGEYIKEIRKASAYEIDEFIEKHAK